MPWLSNWRQARGRGKQAVRGWRRRMLPRVGRFPRAPSPTSAAQRQSPAACHVRGGGARTFEASSVRLLKAAVPPGDVVYDVWASISFVGYLLMRWVDGRGGSSPSSPSPPAWPCSGSNLETTICHNVEDHATSRSGRAKVAQFSLTRPPHIRVPGWSTTAREAAVGTGKVRTTSPWQSRPPPVASRPGRIFASVGWHWAVHQCSALEPEPVEFPGPIGIASVDSVRRSEHWWTSHQCHPKIDPTSRRTA